MNTYLKEKYNSSQWISFLARFFPQIDSQKNKNTNMQRTNTIALSTPVQSSEISPEFVEWLTYEKADAVRHQRRTFKATIMLAMAIVLFLLKEQSHWVADLLNLDSLAAG